MPLGSLSENPSDICVMHPLDLLSKSCKKKLGSQEKFGRKRGSKFYRDLKEKSANFSTLATSNIKLLLFFGEEGQ